MRATYSYESILRAVGRMLDQSGVEGIALHETNDGIVIEGMNQTGKTQMRMVYDLADLCNLMDQAEEDVAGLFVTPTAEPQALHDFLARHEVVAVR